jgi:hypothetical protein
MLLCVSLLASFWVDAIYCNGTYDRATDAAARSVAKAVVTVIRNSV